MTNEELRKANELKDKIFKLERFIDSLKYNSNVRIFNKLLSSKEKHNISVVISDYMRPFEFYELNREQRYKLISILEDEKQEYMKQLEEMQESEEQRMIHKFIIELTDDTKGYEDGVDYLERVYGA